MARRSLVLVLTFVLCATTAFAEGASARRPGREVGPATPVQGTKVIGHSVHGRKIIAYHLGDPAAKYPVLILGQMHGDEPAGVTIANSIISGRKAVEGIDLWVIPTMNPDGYARGTRQNAHGVDLNRNWPDKWRRLNGEYYSGRRPFSEPETRAMARFLKWLRPDYMVSLHQPLDGVDTTDGHTRAYRRFRDVLARNLGMRIKAFNCWSVCHGSMTGWYDKHHLGTAAETIEFGAHPSHAYLVGRARKGIVAALGGSFGPLRSHDPRQQLTIKASSGKVRVSGWTYDPDATGRRLVIELAADGRRAVRHQTNAPSPHLNANRGIRGRHAFTFAVDATPGRHRYCFTVRNLRAGADTRTCEGVSVQP